MAVEVTFAELVAMMVDADLERVSREIVKGQPAPDGLRLTLRRRCLEELLLTVLKIGISVAIIAYLVMDACQNQVFGNLAAAERLVAAVARRALVQHGGADLGALVLPGAALTCRLRSRKPCGWAFWATCQPGPMGIVGGDLVKAVMLAWNNRATARGRGVGLHRPGHRPVHAFHRGLRGDSPDGLPRDFQRDAPVGAKQPWR